MDDHQHRRPIHSTPMGNPPGAPRHEVLYGSRKGQTGVVDTHPSHSHRAHLLVRFDDGTTGEYLPMVLRRVK
jgi:hypothetical protein